MLRFNYRRRIVVFMEFFWRFRVSHQCLPCLLDERVSKPCFDTIHKQFPDFPDYLHKETVTVFDIVLHEEGEGIYKLDGHMDVPRW